MRRLSPAFLTTVAVSLLVGALLFSLPYMKKLAEAAITSVLCVSNIYFWSDAGYWGYRIDVQAAAAHLVIVGRGTILFRLAAVVDACLGRAQQALGGDRAGGNGRRGKPAFAGYLSLDYARVTFYWMPWRAFKFMIGAGVIRLETVVPPRGRLWPELMAAAGLAMILVPFLRSWRSYAVPVSRRAVARGSAWRF